MLGQVPSAYPPIALRGEGCVGNVASLSLTQVSSLPRMDGWCQQSDSSTSTLTTVPAVPHGPGVSGPNGPGVFNGLGVFSGPGVLTGPAGGTSGVKQQVRAGTASSSTLPASSPGTPEPGLHYAVCELPSTLRLDPTANSLPFTTTGAFPPSAAATADQVRSLSRPQVCFLLLLVGQCPFPIALLSYDI